jgi:hypothetical protein
MSQYAGSVHCFISISFAVRRHRIIGGRGRRPAGDRRRNALHGQGQGVWKGKHLPAHASLETIMFFRGEAARHEFAQSVLVRMRKGPS